MDAEGLHAEYIVCHARGYPDPFRPVPQTLEAALDFQRRQGGKIKTRKVSEWREVPLGTYLIQTGATI